MGRAKNKQSGAPLREIGVALVADSGSVSAALARTTTDTGGVFYLDVPKPGTYRVAFTLESKTMLSDSLTVSGGDVQREFVVDVGEDPTYFEFQVEKPVRARPDQPAPRYPESMRSSGIQGEVLIQFVVDTLGHAEMSTFKVLRSNAAEFTNAVRGTLPQIDFFPAELNHRKVRQLVQMPFLFCFNGGSPRAAGPDTGKYWWVPKASPRGCSR